MRFRGLVGLAFAMITASAFAASAAAPRTACARRIAAASPVEPGLIRIALMNMSGQRREVVFGKAKLELPVAEHVMLQVRPGDVVCVASDSDSKVREQFAISRQDAGRLITVR